MWVIFEIMEETLSFHQFQWKFLLIMERCYYLYCDSIIVTIFSNKFLFFRNFYWWISFKNLSFFIIVYISLVNYMINKEKWKKMKLSLWLMKNKKLFLKLQKKIVLLFFCIFPVKIRQVIIFEHINNNNNVYILII